ncbi:MAG: hypothetical protein ACYTEQ_26845 [Planctomycetota bacterium]|jgi:hypothetical protein
MISEKFLTMSNNELAQAAEIAVGYTLPDNMVSISQALIKHLLIKDRRFVVDLARESGAYGTCNVAYPLLWWFQKEPREQVVYLLALLEGQ